MRSFRNKPVGWRGESYRHYLAAKYGTVRFGKSGYPVQSSVVPRTEMLNIIEQTMVGHPEDVQEQKEYEAGVLKQEYGAAVGSGGSSKRHPLRGELVLGTPQFEKVVRLKDMSLSAAARAKYEEEPKKDTEFVSLSEFQKSSGEYGDELKGQEGPAGFVDRILHGKEYSPMRKEEWEKEWEEYRATHPADATKELLDEFRDSHPDEGLPYKDSYDRYVEDQERLRKKYVSFPEWEQWKEENEPYEQPDMKKMKKEAKAEQQRVKFVEGLEKLEREYPGRPK